MQIETQAEQIAQTFREHIISKFPTAEADGPLDLDVDLLGTGVIDSMGVMELISFTEEEFGVAVDDEEIFPANFRSIRALTRLVAQKKGLPLDEGDDAYVEEFRGFVTDSVPVGAVILVVNRGDESLLQLEDRTGWHFPRDEAGEFAGSNPEDGTEALAQVEALRSQGATHIAFPAAELWWLDFYTELRDHLQSSEVARGEAGAIYYLEPDA